MHDGLRVPPPAPPADPALAAALAQAAAALARLDQALAGHPLLPALLHRARLAAVRRQAAADGLAIDPWHLAAVLEGLRLRMAHALRVIDRGAIFAAARHALELHQWLTAPDRDQEVAVRRADQRLAAAVAGATPLLAAASGLHAWLGWRPAAATAQRWRRPQRWRRRGGARPPMRAALVRFWVNQRSAAGAGAADRRTRAAPRHALGADRLGAGVPDRARREAEDALELLFATGACLVRRPPRGGRPAAPFPAAAASTSGRRAAGLGHLARRRARHGGEERGGLLDAFCAAGIAVEVTHRCETAPVRPRRAWPRCATSCARRPAGTGPRARPAAPR